jgi:hypothetical protein
MKEICFDVWKSFVSIVRIVILMFLKSYFHYWILIFKLVLIIYFRLEYRIRDSIFTR